MCVRVCKEADKITAVPLPIPSPAARKRPLAERSLPKLPPFLPLPAAHPGATAQRLPKGNAGRDARKRHSLCGLGTRSGDFQPPRAKGGRPAAPGTKPPGSEPRVPAEHRPPLPGDRLGPLPPTPHTARLCPGPLPLSAGSRQPPAPCLSAPRAAPPAPRGLPGSRPRGLQHPRALTPLPGARCPPLRSRPWRAARPEGSRDAAGAARPPARRAVPTGPGRGWGRGQGPGRGRPALPGAAPVQPSRAGSAEPRPRSAVPQAAPPGEAGPRASRGGPRNGAGPRAALGAPAAQISLSP